MSHSPSEFWIAFGTAILAAATIWLAWITARPAKSTQKNDKEVKAIELFITFNDLQHTIANEPEPHSGFWPNNSMLAITEGIHKLTIGDECWNRTVIWMLEHQKLFLDVHGADFGTFVPSFSKLMAAVIPSLRDSRPRHVPVVRSANGDA